MSDNFKPVKDSDGDAKQTDGESKPKISIGLIGKFKQVLHKSVVSSNDELPSPFELQDLFQIQFNQLGSCIETQKWPEDVYKNSNRSIWQKETQSMQLFFKKFNGTLGLLEKLKSCKSAPNNQKLVGLQLSADEGHEEGQSSEPGLFQRKMMYGSNKPTESENQSIASRILSMIFEPINRFLIIGAMAAFLLGLHKSKDESNEQGIRKYEAVALIATLMLICFIDSITAKRCEDDISNLTQKLQNQKVLAFRDGEIQKVDANEIVVGDVYLIEPGIMIPADSVLIQSTDNYEEATSPYIKDSSFDEAATKANKPQAFQLNDIFKMAQKEVKQEKQHVWVNEMDVTGLKYYQKKDSFTLSEVKEKENSQYSNILYSKSFIVSGFGKALVCAVGNKTQFGIKHVAIQELTLREIQSPTRQTLMHHRTRVLYYINIYIILSMIVYFIQRIFNYAKVDGQIDLEASIQLSMQQIVVMITILVALDPEGFTVAFQATLVNFNSQNIFRKSKLIYRDTKGLEVMGQTDCLFIDLSSWIAKNIEGKSTEEFEESIADNECMDVIRTIAYFLQLPKIQVVVTCRQDAQTMQVLIDQIKKQGQLCFDKNSIFDQDNLQHELLDSKEAHKFIEKITGLEQKIQDQSKELVEIRKYIQSFPNEESIDDDSIEKKEFLEAELKNELIEQKNELNDVRFISSCQTTAEKYVIFKFIKQMRGVNKFILATGEKVEDCFLMEQANISVAVNSKQDMVRRSSHIFVKNISFLNEGMQFGRCIFNNIRKYMLYQSTIAINLALFIGIGSIRFKESPLTPSMILWINFVMDTMAALVFGSELPDRTSDKIEPRPDNLNESSMESSMTSKGKKKWRPYKTILDKTEPNDVTKGLFDADMKFLMISQTIYQQIVLTIIFYYGEIWYVWIHKNKFTLYDVHCHDPRFSQELTGPQRWAQEHFYCEHAVGQPTLKNISISFVYETFFWIQMFNITNCRRVFDYSKVPFSRVVTMMCRAFSQFFELFKSTKKEQNTSKYDNLDQSVIEDEEDDARQSQHLRSLQFYFLSVIPAIIVNELIMNFGNSTFRVVSLTADKYMWVFFFAVMSIPWSIMCMKLQYHVVKKIKTRRQAKEHWKRLHGSASLFAQHEDIHKQA